MLRGPDLRAPGSTLEPIVIGHLQTTRGGPTLIHLPTGSRSLGLTLNYPDVIPLGTFVTVMIYASDGEPLQHAEGPIEQFSAPNILYFRTKRDLEPGRYTLRVFAHEGRQTALLTHVFLLDTTE
jgi:hypothetical protein